MPPSEAESPPSPPPTDLPSPTTLSQMPEPDRLAAAASASQAASSASSLASTLHSKAALLTNPAERNRVLRQAYNAELEAHGNSKKARLFSSGTFQGAAGGAGIGGAVGVGLGTVVGTLVGGVASVPGVLVGGLVGAGAGVVHGPWIVLKKLAGGEGEEVKVPREAVEDGSVVVDQGTGQVKAVVDEEGLRRARERAERVEKQGGGAAAAGAGAGGGAGEVKKERKKPRKLEVRKKA